MSIDLSSRCILIVEDEPLIAMEIAAALQSVRRERDDCTRFSSGQILAMTARPTLPHENIRALFYSIRAQDLRAR